MNRNTEMHFSQVPQIHTHRSKFDMSHSHKTSLNCSDIVPIFVDCDIMPGDTVEMDLASLVRMATPIYPIMDNLYADYYFFFVPHRLVMEHYPEFWGENDDPWVQTTPYSLPVIQAPTGGWTEGTLADYMGIPTKVSGLEVNALPFRAYCKVYNDFFRDENLKSNCHIYTDETTRTGMNGTETGYTYVTGTELGGKPCKVAKFHDFFTSALPSPQKSANPVTIPLGTTANVITGTNRTETGAAMQWSLTSGSPIGGITGTQNNLTGINSTSTAVKGDGSAYLIDTGYGGQGIKPSNLYADLSSATAATINALREAFAVQRFYEQLSRTGSRYIELIEGIFGVTSSDARLQRAEYLGGTRIPLNIDQILQTSSTDSVSPQGNVAGFSCTISRDSLFTKSFEEFGTLIGLVAIRHDNTYQQGLHKMWSRRTWDQIYNPFFANLGEEAIKQGQIYAQGTSADDAVFGYQERWAEYRYKENRVSGYMRSNATGSLDVWHFADNYTSLPYLSGDWIDEPQSNVDRTIAVSSQLTHQFIADYYFKCYYTRPMPVYSIPGLIDHV